MIRRALVTGAVAVAVLAGAVEGLSYWLGGGTGTASASVGTLEAASISAAGSGTGAVTLTWDAQAAMTPATGATDVTYAVERRSGARAWAPLSTGPCAGALPYGTSSCVDAPGVSGTYGYRVVARFSTAWTAASNEVTADVVVDVSAPITALSFPVDGTTYGALGFSTGCVPTGLCGTATDETGVEVVRVSVRRDGGGYWTGSGFSGFSEVFVDASLLVPGAPSTGWSVPLPAALDGRYTVRIQARDAVGNDTAPGAATATFAVDVVAPSTTIATTPGSPDGADAWFRRSSVEFVLSATDPAPGSGVAAVEYSLDGGATQTYTGTATLAGQGDHTLSFRAVDALGNAEAPQTVHLKLDDVSPETTIAFAPSAPNGGDGWYTSSPTFTLEAADASSGVAATYYRVDGGPATAYAGPVAVPEGQHTVTYWSVDVAGNTEETHTTSTVKVDTVDPATTVSTAPAAPGGSNGWFTRTSVELALSASDATSGVSATRYAVDGGATQTYSAPVTVGGQGVHTVAYWSVDAAGNTEATSTLTVKLDAVAPTTTLATTPATPDGSNGWFRRTSVGVTLAATDATSGVTSTAYTVDGGAPQAYTGTFAVATPGDHTIGYWSTDAAGNVEAVRTAHVKLDAAAPATTLQTTPSAPNGANGWFTSSVSFTLSASDGASGVAGRFYSLDGGATQTYSGAVSVPAGVHTVEYWSTDNAGNAETHATTQVKVDSVAPSSTFATIPGSPDGANGWFKRSSVTFTLAATDATSGVAARLFTIDGGPQQTYSAPVTVSTQGDHTVTYWSVDNAGNAETVRTTHVKLDNVAPAVSVGLTAAGSATPSGTTVVYKQNDATAANRTFRLRATATDATSQPASASFPAIGASGWTHAAEASVTTPGAGVYDSSPFTWTTSASNPPAYTVIVADQAGNTATQAITFASDVTAPTSSFSLGDSPAGAFLAGTTLYFRSVAPGSFTLVDTTTDSGSGPASVSFPAIATSGWTHAAETVTTGSGTPPTVAYASSQYSWTAGAGTPSVAARTVTATDRVGNASSTVLAFTPDNTGPTGGALTVNGTAASAAGTSSADRDGSFTIARADYNADAGAGLATSVLTRESAPLNANGTCGSFGGATVLTGAPAQTGLADGCHRFTLTGTDRLGNSSSVSTTVVVDSTEPSVAIISVEDGPSGREIFRGTTTEASGTITIRVYLLGLILVRTYTFTPTSTTWSFETGSNDLLGLLTYTAVARQTDAAGNTSDMSDPITFQGN